MRRDIAGWIERDPERRRVYETDPTYRAQARLLSDLLDAVEQALRIHEAGFGRIVIESAMLAAITAVLGSIEAAETRATQMKDALTLEQTQPASATRKWGLPPTPLIKD